MNKSDLRIGNYVFIPGLFQISTIAEPVLSIYQSGEIATQRTISHISNYKPVLLTEEWLLKLGFEKRDDQKYYHTKFDRTWVSLDSILVKWYGNALGGIMMLDYVHQLQNIFFVINNEELKIP